MKLQRFFVGVTLEADRLEAPIRIPSLELVHQLKKVFRFAQGDEVVLFDGSGYDYKAVIQDFDKESVSFTIIDKQKNTVAPLRETYLFSAIVKKDTFEWIAEKATELGVSHIVPIVSERSEKKDVNQERLSKIIREAVEQSGRATLPKLHEVQTLEQALDNFKNIKSVVWEPGAEKFSRENLGEILGSYIGPEGGWSPKELELFRKNNISAYSLGPQILRAETAVIACLSQLVF